jgi:hypothetical protein
MELIKPRGLLYSSLDSNLRVYTIGYYLKLLLRRSLRLNYSKR